MSLSGRELLQHILDEAEYLYDRSRGLTSEEFLQDHTLRRAFVPPPRAPARDPAAKRELLRSLETRVVYVGSPEHKDMPSFAGQPRPRADASLCPQELTRDKAKVEEWLREAIRRGAVSELREGDFPRYVWFEQDGVVYEGRLVNRGLGQYKGYPLEPGQGPTGLGDLYA